VITALAVAGLVNIAMALMPSAAIGAVIVLALNALLLTETFCISPIG
jgi:hypothetical protein